MEKLEVGGSGTPWLAAGSWQLGADIESKRI
jgi:hypothetical protein